MKRFRWPAPTRNPENSRIASLGRGTAALSTLSQTTITRYSSAGGRLATALTTVRALFTVRPRVRDCEHRAPDRQAHSGQVSDTRDTVRLRPAGHLPQARPARGDALS